MAAVSLRFLAHCFKMTLPVSLSLSAERARIFIISIPAPSLSSTIVQQLGLFSFLLTSRSLAARRFFFFFHLLSLSLLYSQSCPPIPPPPPHVTASLEPLEWGMGERGSEREKGREEERRGEPTVFLAHEEAVEFCRLPR